MNEHQYKGFNNLLLTSLPTSIHLQIFHMEKLAGFALVYFRNVIHNKHIQTKSVFKESKELKNISSS